MANLVISEPLPNRPAIRRRGVSLWQFAFLSPVLIGVIVGGLSLMIGADIGYVSLQLLLFLLVVPLLFLMSSDDRFAPAVILAGFAKAFLISQVVSVAVWHRPDVALLSPELTEAGIAAGVIACIAGILISRVLVAVAPMRQPLLTWNPEPSTLRWLGDVTGVIGLAAQVGWTFHVSGLTGDQHSGVGNASSGAPIFSFLAPLAIVSMCCFAAEQLIRTDRRALFSTRLVIVLAIYFAAVLPLVSKTEPLRPLVALSAVAIVYGWKPKLGPVLAGLTLFVIVMEVFYPAVTLSRMEAFGRQEPLPVVFAEVLAEAAVNPSELSYAKTYSDNFELGEKQNYYGQPTGFWERFAPQVTDRLVTASAYVEPKGLSTLGDALAHIQPHVLGSKLTEDEGQQRIEMALSRRQLERGKVGWANSGFVGDGFVAGGFGMTIIDCLLLGLLTSIPSRLVFVSTKKDVLWIPLFCMLMFTFSDNGFVSSAYYNFWTWVMYVSVLYALLWYMRARSRVRAVARAAAAA